MDSGLYSGVGQYQPRHLATTSRYIAMVMVASSSYEYYDFNSLNITKNVQWAVELLPNLRCLWYCTKYCIHWGPGNYRI